MSTLRTDGTIQSSLVNAGVMSDPFISQQVPAFVAYGKVKLANLRERSQIAVTYRAGWRWVALAIIEGHAQLIGPDEPDPTVDAEKLSSLHRPGSMATDSCTAPSDTVSDGRP